MKKFTLLLFATILGLSIYAQNIIIDNEEEEYPWEYNFYRDYETDIGWYVADEFSITENTAIGEIVIPYVLSGTGLYEDASIRGISLFIYKDINGIPSGIPYDGSSAILSLDLLTINDFEIEQTQDPEDWFGTYIRITISITELNNGNQIILEPGTYWLSSGQVHDLSIGNGETMSRTGSIMPNSPLGGPLAVDPDNIFPSMFDEEWFPLTDNFPQAKPMSFLMKDEQIVGYESLSKAVRYSVYPNPTLGIVNIDVRDGSDLEMVEIFDITGNLILSQSRNYQIDLSMFPTGVYILKAKTTEGNYYINRIQKK